ncbi:MAG: sigma-E processing peptidase SpoIIGA [Oscillospiraceae bacterium]|nr:sigma-E processing peptidase SpoIIGA [Oscillospiraceae bacterium]
MWLYIIISLFDTNVKSFRRKGGGTITVYIDVLIITSVYIDFFLIKATAAVLRRPPPTAGRAILGALAGSLTSLILLLPSLNNVLLFLLKTASAAVIVYISMGFESMWKFIRDIIVFTAVSLCFAGVCFFLSETLAEELIFCRNSTVYFNISPIVLILSTAAAYGGICLFRRFSDAAPTGGKYTVTVYTDKDSFSSFPAVADTGNSLTDVITGIPVIVCGREQLPDIAAMLPEDGVSLPKGWRLIPCNTAGSSGLIPIFRPQSVYIRCGETGRTCTADVYIGISSQPMKYGVFSPSVLRSM